MALLTKYAEFVNKIFAWILVFITLGVFIYLIADVLLPFVISFIFAYLLEPLIANNAIRWSIPRGIVTISVFALFIVSITTGLVFLIPVIYSQIALFISKIPGYKLNLQEIIQEGLAKIETINPSIASNISEAMQGLVNSAFAILAGVADNLWSYTVATINFFAIVALVPVILYYFLRDWPKIVRNIEGILPVQGKSKTREIFSGINNLLSAYIRGQLNICFLLGIYYVAGLKLIGIDLALLLGMVAGFLVIIPFIGALISLCLMMTSCYFSYGVSPELLYILILVAAGHIIEGYILTPKIIGNRIGLHPVWIIFAVFAAGSLFGFIGIIFAIPIAGIIKLLLRHLIDYYKSSKLYKG